MNIQNLMNQAKKMQKEILDKTEKINNTIFTGEASLVKVQVSGDKKIKNVEILNKSEFNVDDLEIVEDMILIAINDAFSKIDKELNKINAGIPGMNNLM